MGVNGTLWDLRYDSENFDRDFNLQNYGLMEVRGSLWCLLMGLDLINTNGDIDGISPLVTWQFAMV